MGTELQLRLQRNLTAVLIQHVEPMFKRGMKLTLIARDPDNPEADVLVTSDSMDGIAALVERSKSRMEIPDDHV